MLRQVKVKILITISILVVLLAPVHSQEQNAIPMNLNEIYEGELVVGTGRPYGRPHYYLLELDTDTWVDVLMSPVTGSGIKTWVELRDLNNDDLVRELHSNDVEISSIENYFLPAGSYYVYAWGNQSTGSYELQVRQDTPLNIELDTEYRFEIDYNNTSELFQLDLSEETTLYPSLTEIESSSSSYVDWVIELVDPTGETQSWEDFITLSAGTHYISIRNYIYRANSRETIGSLLFTLESTDGNSVASDSERRISVGETVSGELPSSDSYNTYRLDIETDTTVDILVIATEELDPNVELLDQDRKQLTFDDDSGEGLNALVEAQYLPAGTYYIRVDRYDSSTDGTYHLTVLNSFHITGSFPIHDDWSGLREELENSLDSGLYIEYLTCTSTDIWFIATLKPKEISVYATVSLIIIAEGGAEFIHVLPVPDKSIEDYRNEALLEIFLYVGKAPFELLPFASFLLSSGETLANVATIIHEGKQFLALEEAKRIGIIELRANHHHLGSSILFHLARNQGNVATQATYFVREEDVSAWILDNYITETNVTVLIEPIELPVESLCG